MSKLSGKIPPSHVSTVKPRSDGYHDEGDGSGSFLPPPRTFNLNSILTVAMVLMLIQHAGYALFYITGLYMADLYARIYLVTYILGLVTFPMFAFCLVEGFMHENDPKGYTKRIAMLALITELPYDLFASRQIINPYINNMLFSMLAGCLIMWACVELEKRFGKKSVQYVGLSAAALLLGMIVMEVFNVEDGAFGLAFILVMYWFRDHVKLRAIIGSVVLFFVGEMTILGLVALFVFWYTHKYNGELGDDMGRGPYIFQPVHLLIVTLLGVIISARYF